MGAGGESAAGWPSRSAIGGVRQLVRGTCSHSGIETRYSCAPAYLEPPQASRFAPGAALLIALPRLSACRSMSASGAVGHCGCPPGAGTVRTARGQGIEQVAATVTHLLAVSCTGFFAPGLDFALARQLQLPATVRRTLIGFMGCAAAFNGLRTAAGIMRPAAGACWWSASSCARCTISPATTMTC